MQDNKVSREEYAQDSWTRELHLYIPVYNVDVWNENIKLIERLLNFLSGDKWRLFFRKTAKPYSTLYTVQQQLKTGAFDCVSLFSGGMDSFIGAIDLLEQERNPLLISQYEDSLTPCYQKACVRLLEEEYGFSKINQVKAYTKFPDTLYSQKNNENTLRARSFLFFALAGLAINGMEGATQLYVPENGLISINVPLHELRLGALSTRTTHPFYIARLQELFDKLGFHIELTNLYKFKTKGEMATECKNSRFLKIALKDTISCSSPGKARWEKQSNKHCGHCLPCIIRQAAIYKAFEEDDTEYKIALPTNETLNSNRAEGNNIKAFKSAIERIEHNPLKIKSDINIPGPLIDYSLEDVDRFIDVYKRGMLEVKEIVKDVEVF